MHVIAHNRNEMIGTIPSSDRPRWEKLKSAGKYYFNGLPLARIDVQRYARVKYLQMYKISNTKYDLCDPHFIRA